MAVTAAELSKLVTTAVEASGAAEQGDASQQGRALDVLKLLAKKVVTAELLKDTEAGKKVNKLSKSSNSEVAAAAAAVVQAWKGCVKAQTPGPLQSQSSQESKPSQSGGTAASKGFTAVAPSAAKTQPAKPAAAAAGAAPPAATPAAAAGSGVARQGSTASLGSGGGSGSGAPARSSRPPPPTGNSKRDRIRTLLLEGFLLVPEDEAEGDAGAAAAAVETAVYNMYPDMASDYAAKVRSLAFNLKDANNPDLRRAVLAGDVTAEQLVTMSPEELASRERQAQNKKIKEQAAWEVVRGQQQTASTDAFK